MDSESVYPYNSEGEYTVDSYIEHLRADTSLNDVLLNFTVESLDSIQAELAKLYLAKEFDPYEHATHFFLNALTVYVGECYLRNHNGTWVSSERENFRPHGIKRDGQVATSFVYYMHDTFYQYPDEYDWSTSTEGLFNLRTLCNMIEPELNKK
ncbi:hypothetical protein A3850_016975 [Lewinella sp. 4G2]|nr:hypothetical protein A3850_016975 [Lewinella sp. 4G2]